MSKLTASYLAGFIDGEGYLGIIKDINSRHFRRTPFYKAVIKVANTNKEIIYWLKDSYGGVLHERKMKEGQKDAYCWTIEGDNLVPFLSKIQPYLRLKREQAEILQRLRKTFVPSSYVHISRIARNGGRFLSKTTKIDVLIERENLYQKIRELNKRGTVQAERLSEVALRGCASPNLQEEVTVRSGIDTPQ